jgi:hypothetical protein
MVFNSADRTGIMKKVESIVIALESINRKAFTLRVDAFFVLVV